MYKRGLIINGMKGKIPYNKGVYSSLESEIKEYIDILHSGFWARKRLEILSRDCSTCQKCGNFGVHIDHIIPWRVSKDNSNNNLQALCQSCNSKKVHEDKKIWE